MLCRHFLMFSVLCVSVSCVFGYNWSDNPGNGSEANPYQISEPNHLIAINDLDTTGVYFVMTNDIDLDPNLPGNQVFGRGIITTETFPSFSGVFDGNSYAIRNMTIAEVEVNEFLGLFEKIAPEGVVRNLTIADYNIRVQKNGYFGFAGSLAGQNLGVIINCFSSGSAGPILEDDWFSTMIGGLVGINGDYGGSDYEHRGLIANSGSCSTLTILYGGAGLVSYNFGSVYQCYARSYITDGQLSSMDSNGGLVGINGGVLNRSFSNSVMETDSNSGLSGYNDGIIRNCYALGNMKDTTSYGQSAGLVAENYDFDENKGARIENCYAACQLGSEGYVQALAGGDYYFYSTALSSFWDVDVSGTTESWGGKGLTTAQMKDPNNFINAGWDFVGETVNGVEDIWQMDPNVNDGYPSLVFKPIDGGDGSAANPYIIYTKQQLLDFFNDPSMWDKHIKLIANIDVSDMTFTSPPVDTFNGVFDGSGCTIDGLMVDGSGLSGELGLFNVIGRNGCVKNLYVTNASITNGTGGILAVLNTGVISDCHVQGTVADGEYCGGLVAINDNLISRCSADCNVSGGIMSFGGLVGHNSFFGDISESYSEGTVDSSGYSGGLVGENYGKIQHSYSAASVTGSWSTGALVGNNEFGAIICCYATGQVADDKLVGFNSLGVVAHSYYGAVPYLDAWEGNSWYKEDGHIWTVNPDLAEDSHPSLKWQRWGTPVSISNTGGMVPFYRQDPIRDGSAEHPYVFSFDIANYPADWDKHFVMTEDVDMVMTGAPVFDEAVIPYFNGTLDGGGHVVSNLIMENQNDFRSMGFFGMLGYDAQIRQLGIEGEVNCYGRFPALFAGINFGTLEECYAKGSVSCDTYGGILTGLNAGTIRSCYAKGTLTLDYIPQTWNKTPVTGGGLYGRNWGRVINSYADVEVNHTAAEPVQSGIGGLNEGLVWNSFWNIDLTDPNFSLGGKPLTTAQMQDADSFVGWGDNIWKIADGNDLPRLAWENTDWVWTPENPEPPECWWEGNCPKYVPIVDIPRVYGGGNGTVQSPYVLTTADHLLILGEHLSDCDKYFVLGDDIDLSGQTFTESVIGYFAGHFNGAGHSISGLTIDRIDDPLPDYSISAGVIGLFGCIDTGGVVENLAVKNVDVSAVFTTGALAGENNGTIRQCFTTGNITAGGNAGGLTGTNGFMRKFGAANIENCYSNVNVNCNVVVESNLLKSAGAMAGINSGNIRSCYATGSVTQTNNSWYPFDISGFAGRGYEGLTENCYYLSGIDDFYALQLSYQQMTQHSSYIDWDFVGDTNGNQDIWRMCVDGVSYPRLSWEFSADGDFACPDGVGLDDLAALGQNWLASVETQPESFNYACDANNDGKINLVDYSILSANWLTGP